MVNIPVNADLPAAVIDVSINPTKPVSNDACAC